MVGARGFEPPASRSRTVRSTKLSYAPTRACGKPIRAEREAMFRGNAPRERENTAPSHGGQVVSTTSPALG